MADTPTATVSAWTPFRYRAFSLLWAATLISNVGTWMHEVGAGWLMTTLSPSPAVVSLVQAATTLPVFLFALLAGTLADRLDKRKMLIVINLMLMVVVSTLTVIVHFGLMTPTLLILFTLVIGTGSAFMAPAWQSIVPGLVPREALQPAIALNSMGVNISRAIGPALAGLLIAVAGLASPFAINALSFVAILVSLFLWKNEETPTVTHQPIWGAMLTGVRHVRHNDALKATLIRAVAFFLFASAYWALLPIVARNTRGGGAELYGFLLTLIGAGAVTGALVLSRIRAMFDSNRMAQIGTVGTAGALALMALAADPVSASVAAFIGGFSWISVLTTFNVSAQTALPNWIRARGLSVYLMVFFGSMALGSLIWGQVATYTSPAVALITAAVGSLVCIPLTRRFHLGQGEGRDLTPSMHWPAPPLAIDSDDINDRGPVLITVTYQVTEENVADFRALMQEWSKERMRDGAFEWNLYQSAESPELWIEAFRVPSWEEHLAHHGRVSHEDAVMQDKVHALDTTEGGPVVRHYIAP
ncbi:MFS transporter [Sulfitobacter sp. S190]|uniref:MFS transporter n=1 Tax=Sulfitobacter sp. S190 TaxID=2867022 RepID=UPI0021A6E1DA|nr:MFS transporter [Sulfitobacter sp. S190]UWR24530.1 MFS transporter [Sulfitobacter sp. S190]